MSDRVSIKALLESVEVEWKSLGEVVNLSNVGVDKKSLENEKKVRLLNFVDVFKNQYISNETPTMIVTASEKKIIDCSIKQGDIFITPSSELIDEIGQSSMAIEDFENSVYSYHIMRLRINNLNVLLPSFLNYLFQSNSVKKQIRLKAQGITRFGLTQPNWKSISIPIPPPSIQNKIVKILDTFTELTAELNEKLTAELTARKKQYSYYRDKLLSFEDEEVEFKALGEVGEFIRGKRFVRKDMKEKGFSCIHYGEMYTHYNVWAKEAKSFIDEELASKLRVASYGDVVIVAAGETIEDIGRGTAWLGDKDVVIHDACFYFKSNLNPKYVAYFTRTRLFHDQIKRYISSGKISAINAKGLSKAKIPIPYPNNQDKSLKEQQRIVSILDKFDTLTNSISEGLLKEIKLREQQYEYYRDLLLTFPKESRVE